MLVLLAQKQDMTKIGAIQAPISSSQTSLKKLNIISRLEGFFYFRYRCFRRGWFIFLRSFVFWGFRLWLKEIHNVENLPRKGPVMIVSNHVSYYDWSVLSSILRNQVVFIGAQELQTRPIVRWLMKLNTLIYIDRENPGVKYFREVIRAFKEKKIVVVYPEGTRSRTGKRLPAKPGFIKLAMLAKIPLIPIGMKGTYKILPAHKNLPRFKKCEIFVGGPILIHPGSDLFHDLLNRERNWMHPSQEAMLEMAERVMDKIGEMIAPTWDTSVLRRWPLSRTVHRRRPQQGEHIAAFFDVDRTLVACHTQKELAQFLYKKRILPRSLLYKAMLWFLLYPIGLVKDDIHLRESLYSIFNFYSVAEWDKIFADCFEQRIKKCIYFEAAESIKDHQIHGHEVVLLSASVSGLVKQIARHFKLNLVYGTELEITDGRYTGKIKETILSSSSKARQVETLAKERQIDLLCSYAYGDSFGDIRMLSKVGNPIAVNPDRRLQLFAKRKKWSVIHFR